MAGSSKLPGLHAYLPRSETNAVMTPYLVEDGWYLLRPSFTNEGLFSICVTFRGSVKHFKILQDERSQQYYVSSRRFATIAELLQCYKTIPLKSKNCQVYLLNDIPVDRDKERQHMIKQGIDPMSLKSSLNEIQMRPLPGIPGQSHTLPRPSRPLPEVPQETTQGGRGERRAADVQRPKVHRQREKEKRPLPPGWSEHFSQQHQRPYYFNSSTQQTTWKRPQPPPGTEDINYVTMQKSVPQSIPNQHKQPTSDHHRPQERAVPPVPVRNHPVKETVTMRQNPSQSYIEMTPAAGPVKSSYIEMNPASAPASQSRRNTTPEVNSVSAPGIQSPRRQTAPEIGDQTHLKIQQTPSKNNVGPPPPFPVRKSGPANTRGRPLPDPQNGKLQGREDAPPPLPSRSERGVLPPPRGSRELPPVPPNRDVPPPVPSNRDAPPPVPSRGDMPPRSKEEKPLPSAPRGDEIIPPVPNRGVSSRGETAVPPIPTRHNAFQQPVSSKSSPKLSALQGIPHPIPEETPGPPPVPSRGGGQNYPTVAAPAIPGHDSVNERQEAPPLPSREETRKPDSKDDLSSMSSMPPPPPRLVNPLPPVPPPSSKPAVSSTTSLPPPPPPHPDPIPFIAAAALPPPLPPDPDPSIAVAALPAAAPLPPPPPIVPFPDSAIPPPPLPPPPPPPSIDEIPPPLPTTLNHAATLPSTSKSTGSGVGRLLDEIKAFGGDSSRLRSASVREINLVDPDMSASEGDIISALKTRLNMVHVATRQDESDEEFEEMEDDDEWN